MFTEPLYEPVVVEYPFDRFVRITFRKAVTGSESVRELPEARKRFPLVCVRPPKLNTGPGKKLRSVCEKTPNWNTGMPTVCVVRCSLTSEPAVVRAVTLRV